MKKKNANKWHIILRAMEPSDIETLYEWENDRSIWQVSNTLVPFSRYVLERYIENSYQDIHQSKQLRLMIEAGYENEDFRTVGAIDLFDYDPFHLRAGIGILIGNILDRHKGIATAALQELIRYSFNTLQLHQLYCNVSADNQASLNLFRNAGFQIIGTKVEWNKVPGGFTDEILLQFINRDTAGI
jgi:diamine N-acetyltransferase